MASTKNKNVIAVVVSDEQKAALEKMHEDSGAPVSFYVRKALAAFLNVSASIPKPVRAPKKGKKANDTEIPE